MKVVPAWRICIISIQGQLDGCNWGLFFRLNRLKIRLLSRHQFSKINKSVLLFLQIWCRAACSIHYYQFSNRQWNGSSPYTLWTNCFHLACLHHLLVRGALLKGLLNLIKERVNGWRSTAQPGDATAADKCGGKKPQKRSQESYHLPLVSKPFPQASTCPDSPRRTDSGTRMQLCHLCVLHLWKNADVRLQCIKREWKCWLII